MAFPNTLCSASGGDAGALTGRHGRPHPSDSAWVLVNVQESIQGRDRLREAQWVIKATAHTPEGAEWGQSLSESQGGRGWVEDFIRSGHRAGRGWLVVPGAGAGVAVSTVHLSPSSLDGGMVVPRGTALKLQHRSTWLPTPAEADFYLSRLCLTPGIWEGSSEGTGVQL